MEHSIAAVILLFLMNTAPSSAQQAVSKEHLVNLSYVLASQMGRVYQMQMNCGLISNVAPEKAAGLMINYLPEAEVQAAMGHYEQAMTDFAGKPCDKRQIRTSLQNLMESASRYVFLARPHMRP